MLFSFLIANDSTIDSKEYNSYKTLYIRSILESNPKLKIEALNGLIESSKKLGLDYKEYEDELRKLGKSFSKITKKNLKSNSKNLKKDISSNTHSKRVVLKSLSLKNGSITLQFNKPLKKDDIKNFSLSYKKKSIYKKIFDIKSIWPYAYREYRLKSVKKLKIAQFKKNILRVVLEDSKPIKLNYSIDKNLLKIYLNSHKTDKKVPLITTKSKKSNIYLNRYKKIIVIDPGHGGKDTGAIGYKRKREKNAVLAIAKKLYKELKRRGYIVYLTRNGDYFVTLRDRTKFANKKMANLFISIHANAAPNKSRYLSMKGVETFFLSPARSDRAKRVAALENKADLSSMSYYSKQSFLDFLNREKIIESNKLAIDVHKEVLYNLRKHFRGVKDGGVREAPFWVLVGTQMPSILIETGYITNPTEAKRLFNPYYQKLLAKGIADGVDSYFAKNL